MLPILKPQFPEIPQTFKRAVLLTDLKNIPGSSTRVRAEVRFDDSCGNGHQTLSICGTIYELHKGRMVEAGGGQCCDEIVAAFPELAFAMPWHLCSTDGPMHYIANTVYHASNRDHNGLLKGEERPILCRDGSPMWQPVIPEGFSLYSHKTGDKPADVVISYKQSTRIGEGKARELDAARRSAIWPDATDEQLMAEPAILKDALQARLPQLLRDFHAVICKLGFTTWDGPV